MRYRPIRRNSEFGRVYARGKSYVNPALVLYVLKTRGRNTRVGLTATKKIGHAVQRNRARRERAQADAGRQRDSRAARRQLIQRQPRKRAAREIPHGILFIKHSCSSQFKILNCYTINHTMKKAPTARGRGAKNALKNAEIFNIRVGRLLRIVILWKQLSGHLAVRGTVNRKKLYWSKILPQADPRTHHSCAYPGPGRTPAKRSCRLFRPSA